MELSRLPLTSNGKIDRKALPDPDEGNLSGKEYIAPRNEVEEKLVAIWQELLRIGQVGIHDNFFELGGHSILAMRVISAIRKVLKVEMSIKDLFQYTTISDLSYYIELEYDLADEFDTTLLEKIKI
ncbi:MAG: phosphopantetheine-binding protein [Chitinophagaceae bacterium]